jgi:hypothetical protein
VQARERVERYQAAASAPNTVRAYRHDWSEWTSWCAEHSYTPLPASPSVIAAYAAVLADRPVISVPTIERRLAAIGRVHREAEIDPPPTRALEVQRGDDRHPAHPGHGPAQQVVSATARRLAGSQAVCPPCLLVQAGPSSIRRHRSGPRVRSLIASARSPMARAPTRPPCRWRTTPRSLRLCSVPGSSGPNTSRRIDSGRSMLDDDYQIRIRAACYAGSLSSTVAMPHLCAAAHRSRSALSSRSLPVAWAAARWTASAPLSAC